MATLLVVDDEPSILLAFRRAFRNGSIDVETAETAREGVERARECRPDVVVLDVQLPDQTGLEAFREFRALDARCPVIFITGKSTTDTAIEAMKLGAFDYLLKPLELAELRQVIERSLDSSRLMHVPAVLAERSPEDDRADAVVGRCPAMQEVYKAIGRVAPQDVTVLITGESGTGKELVARALYQHSRRSAGPFLAINCAALPETLLESELFGHERGAFTGADRQRVGKFEQCSGGTLFLDEVGDLSPLAQARLLRLLEERTFERLGGNETLRTDVRLLAATNQDLAARVAAGRFRHDLYYRLSVVTIHLPPLRERGDDLELLVHHFLRRFSREFGREPPAVSPQAMAALHGHSWPGNVRELQNVVKDVLLRRPGAILQPDALPPFLPLDAGDGEGRTASVAGLARPGALPPAPLGEFIEERLRAGSENLYEEAMRLMDRLLLTRVLEHTAGNQVRAARILGITRGSVRNKMRELGITVGRTVDQGGEPEGATGNGAV